MRLDPRELTGYEQPARQAQWLDGYGVPYMLDRHGAVVVTSEMLKAWAEARVRSKSEGDNELRTPG